MSNSICHLYRSREKLPDGRIRIRWELRYFDETGRHRREKKKTKIAGQLRKTEIDTNRANDTTALANASPQLKRELRMILEESERRGLPPEKIFIAGCRALDHEKSVTPAGPLIPDLVEQYLANQTSRGLSVYYLRDLRFRLHRFAEDFHIRVTEFSDPIRDQWLDALKISTRTRKNYIDAIRSMIRWYQNPEALRSLKIKTGKITIFTPEELSDLLAAASRRILPALAIGAFAGLRTEEIQRLEWPSINFDKGYIFLSRDITKTKTSRTVPLQDNLRAWLEPWRDTSGKVCDYANLSVGKTNLAHRVGRKWKRNGLRHSYISYRVAQTQNLDQVAAEAGNSRAEIHAHYLELVTPQDAARWFSLRPQSIPQNLLNLKFA